MAELLGYVAAFTMLFAGCVLALALAFRVAIGPMLPPPAAPEPAPPEPPAVIVEAPRRYLPRG